MSLLKHNEVLRHIYDTRSTLDRAGSPVAVPALLKRSFAEALYRTVLSSQPEICVEIGMAYALSSLAILTALAELGRGRLISIDPNQSTQWAWGGMEAVKRAGFDEYHQLIEKPSFLALPELLKRQITVDFAYIDGWHTFDYILLDFFYLDKMLPVGGVVAFNDCGLRSTDRVLRFLQSHRKYREMSVGLRPEIAGCGGRARFLSNLKILQMSKRLRLNNDRYFQKLEHWEPSWDFYSEF